MSRHWFTDARRLYCTDGRLLLRSSLVLLLAVLLSACASGPPTRTDNVCSIFHQKYGWHRAALKAEKKWDVPKHITLAIMAQESSFRPKARPPRKYYFGFIPGPRPSSAYGYAQAIKGTWKGYIEDTGEYWREPDDFVDALDFINWYVTDAVETNKLKVTDTYSIYLNYHEGLAGFRRASYEKKPWLKKVAQNVDRRAQQYAKQYDGCKKEFRKRWLFF